MLPAAPPTYPLLCALTNRHRHLFVGLFGCNRLRAILLLSFVNIFIHSSISVSVSVRFFCVEGPCPCVPLLILRESPSFLLFPLSSALRFKTPVVPSRSSTQAYNYPTTYEQRNTGTRPVDTEDANGASDSKRHEYVYV